MENQKPQIIIFVEGGCVTEVLSDDPNIDVTIYDRDNIEAGDAPPCDEDEVRASLVEVY